ncbi:hypothetical protein [Paenibacillus sp. Z6-24]
MMKKAASLLLALALALPLTAHAAPSSFADNIPSVEQSRLPEDLQSFPEDFYIQTDMVSMAGGHTLFADKDHQRIYMANAETSREEWSKSYDHIYNYKVIPGSPKIVLLVEHHNKLQKIVLSTAGKTLSRYSYPDAMLKILKNEPSLSAQIGWSAPDKSGQKEKLALQAGDHIYIYQYPWKKPMQTFTTSTRQSSNYENLISTRVEYQGNDLVIAYQAVSLMQTQYVFDLLDTSKAGNKPHTVKVPWNLKAQMQLENGAAVIYTSNILGSPLGLNADVPYPIYVRYDVKTGKLLAQITRTLSDQHKEWQTDYSQGQLFLADRAAGKLYLYDRSGKPIWETAEPSKRISYRFIKYEQGMVYLLVENIDREFSIAKMPVM